MVCSRRLSRLILIVLVTLALRAPSTQPFPLSPPPPPLKIFNTASSSLEPFCPKVAGEASMYTCGPTVYAPAHIGNFRAMLTYDILKRVLLRVYGLAVTHVLNLTDVDDKIINKCRETGRTRGEVRVETD